MNKFNNAKEAPLTNLIDKVATLDTTFSAKLDHITITQAVNLDSLEGQTASNTTNIGGKLSKTSHTANKIFISNASGVVESSSVASSELDKLPHISVSQSVNLDTIESTANSALQNFNGLSTNTITVGGGADKTANVDFKFVATAMNINPADWKYLTLRTSTLTADKIVVLPSDAGTLQLVNGSGTIISTAERNKLNAIEASADITDATNVAGAGAFMASNVSAFGATLIDDANASTARTTLGLGSASTASISSLGSDWIGLTNAGDMISTLGLGTAATTAATAYATSTQGSTADTNATKLTGISYSSPATTIGNGNNSLIIDNAYANTSTPGYEFNSSAFVLIKKPSTTTHWNMILDRGDNYWSGWKSSHHFDTYNSATKYNEDTTGATYFLQYFSHADINMCGRGGKVGIGGNPSFPLQVNGYSATPDASYRGIRYSDWYTNFGDMGIRSDYDTSDHGSNFTKTSIKSQYTIQASAILLYSDKRIKENIRDISDNSSLQKLRDLPCVYYEYKDPAKGSGTEIGFIAQDVMEHIPLACSLTKEFIPNELRPIQPVWETITDLSGNETFKLTISDLDVSGNTKYRFLCSTGEKGEDIDLENLAEEPKSFIFEKKWDKIFLYGKEVDDFHIIDKNKIFAIAFSATQEIDRIQQQHAIEIATLKQQLSNIENRLTAGNL